MHRLAIAMAITVLALHGGLAAHAAAWSPFRCAGVKIKAAGKHSNCLLRHMRSAYRFHEPTVNSFEQVPARVPGLEVFRAAQRGANEGSTEPNV
jgi:hypothetical protein